MKSQLNQLMMPSQSFLVRLSCIIFISAFCLSSVAQNAGIGVAVPSEKLQVDGTVLSQDVRVLQSGKFDARVGINMAPNNSYRLYVNGGNTFLDGTFETSGSTIVGNNLSVANDGVIVNNFLLEIDRIVIE